jgi:hypothetical protein
MGMLAAGLHLGLLWLRARSVARAGSGRGRAPWAGSRGYAGGLGVVAGCIALTVVAAAEAVWAFPVGFLTVRWVVLRRIGT